MNDQRLLIFTDLDGTLLDHDSYSWEPARPALGQIAARGIPLIFVSSKTRSEILDLRRQLENRHPFVTENGSAVYLPAGYFDLDRPHSDGALDKRLFSTARSRILQVLERLRSEHGYHFRGFADMSVAELVEATGLTPDAAEKAKQRDCSEPIQWLDGEEALQLFRQQLEQEGLRLLRGGRFWHVMGEVDKGDAIRWLIARYRARWPGQRFTSVALGDSPNDLGMLEVVDIPVVIEPARGDALHLGDSERVVYAGAKGPTGWQRAMERILAQTDGGQRQPA
ncbi:MAG TPA: HAD-IIB family hydrolase [Sedimenticola sp.]|nr:HAD-IIB family hydrolase [Sedimenticola sp.]